MGNLREINDTNLSGNVIAAQCVKYPKMFEKAPSLKSDVEVVIKGSDIFFVKRNKTKKLFSSISPSKTNVINFFNNLKNKNNKYLSNKTFDPKDYGYQLFNTDE